MQVGRPKLDPNNKPSVGIFIRATESEKETLRAAANERRMSLSAYLRERGLGAIPQPYVYRQLASELLAIVAAIERGEIEAAKSALIAQARGLL